MFGSLKVATIRGIPIRLHFTLLAMALLLVVQFGWLGLPAGILLFGSVLLHELGHAVTAQKYGIRISSIDLHLLGGMALMTQPPKTAKQEAVIAAAGPAVSFSLGFVFLALSFLTGARLDFLAPRLVDLLAYGAAINLAMGLFNLLPALPMDGGRIFRAVLSTKLGPMPATRIAAWVSRAFAAVFVVLGIASQAWSLVLLGIFLFLLVANELRIARVQEHLRQQQMFVGDPFAGPDGRGPVVDVGPSAGRVTREEYVDPFGRRYVVITRLR
jgi:Zn-dependent protease